MGLRPRIPYVGIDLLAIVSYWEMGRKFSLRMQLLVSQPLPSRKAQTFKKNVWAIKIGLKGFKKKKLGVGNGDTKWEELCDGVNIIKTIIWYSQRVKKRNKSTMNKKTYQEKSIKDQNYM